MHHPHKPQYPHVLFCRPFFSCYTSSIKSLSSDIHSSMDPGLGPLGGLPAQLHITRTCRQLRESGICICIEAPTQCPPINYCQVSLVDPVSSNDLSCSNSLPELSACQGLQYSLEILRACNLPVGNKLTGPSAFIKSLKLSIPSLSASLELGSTALFIFSIGI